jgi:anti-anti-sigma regulatory factor
MEFKIDTNSTFSIITPVSNSFNANLADILADKCLEIRQSGSPHLIIDLQHCTALDPAAIPSLVSLHEESYSNDHSLVFTSLSDKVMTTLKQDETDLLLNVAPKMQEAIDIISMEILERDLLSEE